MTNSPRGESTIARPKFHAAKIAIAALLSTTMVGTGFAQSVDLSKWSPEYVKSIAGTKQFDAAKDCGAVVPNDYTGRVSYWYTGPFEADPVIAHEQDKAFWDAFKAAYPNITTDVQSITYNELLDKFRTAADLDNAATAYRTFTRTMSALIPAKVGPDAKKLNEIAEALIKMEPRWGAAFKGRNPRRWQMA